MSDAPGTTPGSSPRTDTGTAPTVSAGHPRSEDWERLDGRIVVVNVLRVLGPLAPLLAGLTLLGQRTGPETVVTFLAIGVAAVAVTVGDVVRWARTEYRVGDRRVELVSGLFTRTHLTVPRDRIRRVETTSRLAHRVLGLTVVTVGTAEQSGEGDTITLDAVAGARAAALRDELLGSPPAATDADIDPDDPSRGQGSGAGGAAGAVAAVQPIARLHWSWAPLDVLSYWTLLLPALALGGLYQLVTATGVEVDPDVVRDSTGLLRSGRWALIVPAVVLGGLAIGVVGSLALFVTTWWGYELRRERGDTLRLTRGLFTTRSATFDERRLRGVEIHESLLQRLAHAARIVTIAHGVGGAETATGDRKDALAPPVPRREADRIAAAVLRCPGSPAAAPLRRHPRGALARRLVRAAIATAFAAVAAWGAVGPGPLPGWVAAVAATVPLVGVAVALDSYRSLGHAVDGPYLVARSGVLIRRTTALQRSGVIGWTIRQTWFQRRRGLADLVATTAAGAGAYVVVDLDLADAARLARDATVGAGSFPLAAPVAA